MEVAARIQPVTATTLLRQSAGAARRPLWDHLAFALFVAAAALMLATFTDYGVTWDEDVHNWYGVYVLEYYLSFFRDLRSVEWGDVNNYGAAFDMTAAALNHLSPFGVYETRHLLIGIIGAWKLGRCLAGPRAGFIAALFLLLTPNYYGQMFNNPKDIPFAVGMVWAMYYLARIAPELPRPRWTLVVKLGIACGLALGVRVGGLLLFGYLGLLLLLFVLWRGAETRRLGIVIAESWTSFWRVLLPVLLVAWPVMLLFWPWAQQSPLLNPVRAIIYFSHEIFPFPSLFAGDYIPATNLPWAYLPVHIALALPELVFSLLVVAPVAAIVIAQRRRWAFDRTTTLRLFIVVFGIVFPVAYAIAIKAVLFDGMRHFIFVLPPIAVAAALAMDRVASRLSEVPYRQAIYAALGLYGVAHVATMVLLHPDQYVYYNAFVGGVDGAQQKFKIDYWANSYAEAVHGLETFLQNEYGADFEEREFTVAVCGPPVSAAYYFPGNFRFVHRRDRADFFIAFTKDNCDRALPGRAIYRVERMGALLSVVLDRRDIVAEQQVAKRPLARASSRHLPVSDYP